MDQAEWILTEKDRSPFDNGVYHKQFSMSNDNGSTTPSIIDKCRELDELLTDPKDADDDTLIWLHGFLIGLISRVEKAMLRS
jgi:hypothetical protein